MKKLIKEPILWAIIFLLIGITLLNLFTNIDLSEQLTLLYQSITLSWTTILSILSIAGFITLSAVAMIKYDKMKNGKFREDLKIGDKIYYDKYPNCEILEIGEYYLYVKIKIPRHVVTKPKEPKSYDEFDTELGTMNNPDNACL